MDTIMALDTTIAEAKQIENVHNLIKNKGINYELSEEDFYPPEDTRCYRSGINDILGGDNFEDYAKDFFHEYEDELFDN